MQKNKANKWQTSLNQIKKAKLKWRQFSVDKGSVLDHMKSMSFPELQETYNNLPDFFWRDNGEFLINYIFKVRFEVESICYSSGKLSHDLFCQNHSFVKCSLALWKPKEIDFRNCKPQEFIFLNLWKLELKL